MRVAVLNDIHGNLPALEAVVGGVDGERVHAVVCGGDVVSGAFPCEAFDPEHDVEAAAARIRDAESPMREERVGWLIDPPDPAEATRFHEARRGA